MKKFTLKPLFMVCLVVLLTNCQRDDTIVENEEQQAEFDAEALYKRGKDVPIDVLNYIENQTNNTFKVSVGNKKIRLSRDLTEAKDVPFGVIETDKAIEVINENNIKYTFKVSTPENKNSIINLIVVSNGDSMLEYFIKYVYNSKSSGSPFKSGKLQNSLFSGEMIVYNSTGDQIGGALVENGITMGVNGTLNPCEEDNDNPPPPPPNGGGGTGGGGNNGGGEGVDDPNLGGGEYIENPDGCGLDWGYEQCGCGGDANGHEPSGASCCAGSPLVVRNSCTGQAYRGKTGRGDEIEAIDCDGDTGVILDIVIILEQVLEQNPFLLLEIDCNQIQNWQSLAQHKPPPFVVEKIKDLKENYESILGDWNIQYLEDAGGKVVNMDYFAVNITTLPNNPSTGQRFTPQQFIDYFRRNINDFADGTEFEPYCEIVAICEEQTETWYSSDPLGAIIKVDIPLNDGVVVCAEHTNNYWRFMTMEAPFDYNHPVSGTRQFGIEQNSNGSYNIYVRGVDRFQSSLQGFVASALLKNPFKGADDLWKSFQEKTNTFVNANGGTSSINEPIHNRPDWEEVKDVLEGRRPISDLGCN